MSFVTCIIVISTRKLIASPNFFFGRGVHAYWRPCYKYLQNILRYFNQKLYLPVQTSTDKDNFDHKRFLVTLILVLLFNLVLSAIFSFI